MRDEHMVICSPAVFELVSPDSAPVPVKVELTYDSRDPYAVQASFRTGQGTAVDWVFARDLLADGLMASSGTGDVRVQPMPTDPTRIELELNSPSGHAAGLAVGGHDVGVADESSRPPVHDKPVTLQANRIPTDNGMTTPAD